MIAFTTFFGAFLVPSVKLGAILVAIGVTVLLVVLGVVAIVGWRNSALRRTDALVAEFFENDTQAVFLSSRDGDMLWANRMARRIDGDDPSSIFRKILTPMYACPMEAANRLRSRCLSEGSAEDRYACGNIDFRATAQGLRDRILWRIMTHSAGDTSHGTERGALSLIVSPTGSVADVSERLADIFPPDAERLDDVFQPSPLQACFGRLETTDGLLPVAVETTTLADGNLHMTFVAISEPGKGRTLETFPIPLIEMDGSGRITQSNRLARDLLGILEGESPLFASVLVDLGRPVDDWLAQARGGQALHKPEMGRAARFEGDRFVQVTLERAEFGDHACLTAVLHDVTEVKTLEAQIVQAQKMQAIGQLAGGIAHDFNNLLTAIRGHCELLLQRHQKDDEDFSDLLQINQNADRAAGLVGQLLAFSRKQTLRSEPVEMRDILAQMTNLLNRLVGERVELVFHQDPDLKMVRTDRQQLEQVILNLVVNARDAMPDGGRVEIRTEFVKLTEPLRRDRAEVPPGEYVTVKVIDEGVGIDPSKINKIFEPFFTTKRPGEGTGLGLSTAYGIVKQTGGFIFVDSELGGGTTFTLFIPAIERTETVKVVAETPEIVLKAGDGVILLVEDEASVRAVAARALTMRGYTVIEAEDAEQALQILSDPKLHIDLFITDVVMPGRDGPSWVREALGQRPNTHVIFVSGYAQETLAKDWSRIENSTFLPKPFSLAALIQVVQTQLDMAAARSKPS